MNLSQVDFQNITRWIYRNARPLDIVRWQYHFENGSGEEVLKVLSVYQNDDGGFGNAVEADSWNPNSSPYSTAIAIWILDEVKLNDKNHPIIQGILKYLENTPDFFDGYWPAVINSNNDYPHAPWWTFTNRTALEEWGYTPTAMLVGFILCYEDNNSEFFKKAMEIAKTAVDKYLNGVLPNGVLYRDICREGEIDCFYHLLKCIERAKLSHIFKTSELKEALQNQVKKFIEKDTSKWNQYCYKPSAFITSKDSIFYEGNKEIIDVEIDNLLTKRNKDGIWDIVWNWGAYEKEFAISENWWKANKVIFYLLFIRNFSEIE